MLIMELQTKIPLVKASAAIDYESSLLLLGSCFAEHIADKLHYYRFRLLSNPFGILFQPIAIERLIARSLAGERYTEDELFYLNEAWHSFDAHSDLSKTTNRTCMNSLNKGLESTRDQILESTHIIITLGTAWVYRHKQRDSIVANCHKVPQKEFAKELLSTEEVQSSLMRIIELIKSANQNATVVLTVSPVRHLKDGFVENSRSKAHLIAAVQQVVNDNNAQYFPSFELVMDELRDYRFYATDMVHPNELGVNYVWEKFREVWIDPHSYPIMEAVDQVQKGLQHKPFKPDSEAHRNFLKNLDIKIRELKATYPHIQFES